MGGGLGHGFDADDVAADLGIKVRQLLQGARLRIDDDVGQDDGEGLVADDVAGAPDGVAQALGLHLAGEAHLAGRGQLGVHGLQKLYLALGQKLGLQLDLVVEIVLDRLFGAAGDEDDVLDPRLARFLDDVGQDGPINDVQQFLRRGLGAGQDAGAQAGHGKNRLAKARGGSRHQSS
ncbi:hypothetical protein D3C72_1694630 [compost metagenome]